MPKKLLLMVGIGVVFLIIGAAVGYFIGVKFFGGEKVVVVEKKAIQPPGPTIDLGEFNVNLADEEPHLVRMRIVLELTNNDALTIVNDPDWQVKIKNEIILTTKDRKYVDLLGSEGVMELANDIRKRLNSMLPLAKGKPPVKGVYFVEFLVQ